MTDPTKLLLTACLAVGLGLTGCSGDDTDTPADDHAEVEDHDGHDHAEGEGHDDDHGAEAGLSEVTIGETVLNVSVGGDIEPNALLHIDLKHTDGPAPAAIRVWVGDETGAGSVKGLAVGGNGSFHADAQCPATLSPDAELWIEIEGEDGERIAASMADPNG
jgi:hypothetical protein